MNTNCQLQNAEPLSEPWKEIAEAAGTVPYQVYETLQLNADIQRAALNLAERRVQVLLIESGMHQQRHNEAAEQVARLKRQVMVIGVERQEREFERDWFKRAIAVTGMAATVGWCAFISSVIYQLSGF